MAETSFSPYRQRKGAALCLSGGGFRAALFHLGSLRRLNEARVLAKITTITSVSGGSIASRLLAKTWRSFLRNHAAGIASLDLFVVRTISFKVLYGLVILRHARRRLVSISVTENPTAEWIAGQVTDAFPWEEAPRHLLRDRDGAFGPPIPAAFGQ
jgi:hypothetical protein